ncbi:NADPH-dependent FMN reductase [Halobacterium zhouii]|uniref:NADPH-dependent FMN reductase n=1 Tax=Halobacterium zhouii TaxID=2902624 RepID=UPI001E454EF0|nr:NADPH-dependent FMN reductase [Halobacterium zhouii]
MSDTKVVGICGSLRDASVSRIALRRALDEAESRGATTDLLDLRELDLPIFDPDSDDPPDAVDLQTRVQKADTVVLATPMYHGSYASPLKTALDYCGFDEFEGKTVGLLAVSGGSFPITALDHLRAVMRALDAWVLPYQAAIPNASSHVSNGEITDEKLEDRVATLGERVVQYANIEPDPHTFESEQNEGGD